MYKNCDSRQPADEKGVLHVNNKKRVCVTYEQKTNKQTTIANPFEMQINKN